MRAYLQYDSRNVLPASGGWNDQSASFAKCVEVIDAERGWWEQKRQTKIERERKLAEMQRNK